MFHFLVHDRSLTLCHIWLFYHSNRDFPHRIPYTNLEGGGTNDWLVSVPWRDNTHCEGPASVSVVTSKHYGLSVNGGLHWGCWELQKGKTEKNIYNMQKLDWQYKLDGNKFSPSTNWCCFQIYTEKKKSCCVIRYLWRFS